LATPDPVYLPAGLLNNTGQLRHLASEADRGREAMQIVMLLIAILDGARTVGLEVGAETQAVEEILTVLEKGEALPSPH